MKSQSARSRDGILFALVALFLVAWVSLLTTPLWAQGSSSDTLRMWLQDPWVLYGFMVLGSIVSMAKQWKVARMDGSEITFGAYASYLQELAIALGANTLAFFLLVDSGMLNYVSAVTIGYALNSVADLNPMGGRSTALK